MWTNNFTIAIRNLLKRKGFTLLNLLGLTLGITCCLLLFQYVSYEKGYDDFISQEKPLIRLNMKKIDQGKTINEGACTFPFVGEALATNFPEIESYCNLFEIESEPASEELGTALKAQRGIFFADSSAFSFFGIEMIKGSTRSMTLPLHMVISEELAKKLFGNVNPIGKTIAFKGEWDKWVLMVDGVFKNYSRHSHIPIEALASFSTVNFMFKIQNGDTNALHTMRDMDFFYTYLQLRKGTNLEEFGKKINRFAESHINSEDFLKKANRKISLVPVAVKDIHLKSDTQNELKVNGDEKQVSYMFLIAIFILLIAWVNYINLATTQSVERAKEVGIRKMAGARRISLVFQFMAENFLLHLVALLAAIFLATLLTPVFNHATGLGSQQEFTVSRTYKFVFAGIFLSGLLLSGAYPAWILSAYKPIQVLKGVFKNSGKGLVLRKSLIILQFAISNILIVGTLVIYLQVKYMQSQKLGFDMNQLLIVDGPRSVIVDEFEKLEGPFENELSHIPGIKNYTVSTNPMGTEIQWFNLISVEGSSDEKTIYHFAVDFNFIPTYNLAIKAGRNYSKDYGLEQDKVIINETAAHELGFKTPEDAIGKGLNHPFGKKKIIGVVADFHQRSPEKPIQPLLLYLEPRERRYYSLKVSTTNLPATIEKVQATWKKYFGNAPFNYKFLDEIFNEQYKASNQFGFLFGLFSVIAIIIACFGLLGLIAFNITQRTKEIGIRKVLGASIQRIVLILSKDYVELLVIAFVLSIPLAWLAMNRWLLDYAYRIEIHAWVFLASGITAAVIALLTISIKSVKAARANPIKSLRNE